MPKCHVTGKEIPNLPKWLDGVNVKFRSDEATDTSYERILAITGGRSKLVTDEEVDEEEIKAVFDEEDSEEEDEEVEEVEDIEVDALAQAVVDDAAV